MTASFQKVRIGKAGAKHKSHKRAVATQFAQRADCSAAGFYTAPKAGDTVSTGDQVTFKWNTECLSDSQVDIYLYAPSKNNSMIQEFSGADNKHGSLTTTLDPNWWGRDSNISLQLTIVSHGTPAFLSTLPSGPIWTASYDSSKNPVKQNDNPSFGQRVVQAIKSLSPGATAAAVIFPLLAVLAVVAFFYIRHQRKTRSEKTQRFSRAIDSRMSRISGDWRSMTGVGANVAVRESMAFQGSSDVRPISTFSTAGQAGLGAGHVAGQMTEEGLPAPQLRQPSPSFAAGDRVSRVSFAADPRGSIVEKDRPPMPRYLRQPTYEHESRATADNELVMSPTQTHGPELLQPGEIDARASVDGDEAFRREVGHMPAVTLMRTHATSHSGHEQMIDQPSIVVAHSGAVSPVPLEAAISPPAPALFTASSTHGAISPSSMNVTAYPTLSPDDMLRAYAAGRAPASPVPPTPGGMRILYQPDVPSSPVTAYSGTTGAPENNPFRKSMQTSRSAYTDSMYSGMVEEDHYPTYNPHSQNGGAYGSQSH